MSSSFICTFFNLSNNTSNFTYHLV
jgi:hypothetical protein